MTKIILIRYGDITLKGKNKKSFIDTLVSQIKHRLTPYTINYDHAHNRLYLHIQDKDIEIITKELQAIPGIDSFSLVQQVELEVESIYQATCQEIKQYQDSSLTFKIKTKRTNKHFPIRSMELSRTLAGKLLKEYTHLSVDVHNPDCLLEIEIRSKYAYIFSKKIPGLGGFPTGTIGKGYLLLSGGIDSPVAGFLAMKQGIAIEAFHFESTPMTSIESAQKVVDIAKVLARFAPKSTLKLHLVPFKAIHETIIQNIPEPYHITIMRRMMLRFIEEKAEQTHTPTIITGESIGQVASQTLESMKVINAITNRPIIRPLATLDKKDIIAIARKINTYDIAIRPFEDCCSIYLPKQPSTNPRIFYALRYERLFNYKEHLKTMEKDTITLSITPTTNLDLPSLGFTVSEALKGGKP